MASFIKSDLEFILDQIIIAERHAAGEDLLSMLPNVQVPFGLRTVDGSFNNLVLYRRRQPREDGVSRAELALGQNQVVERPVDRP